MLAASANYIQVSFLMSPEITLDISNTVSLIAVNSTRILGSSLGRSLRAPKTDMASSSLPMYFQRFWAIEYLVAKFEG